MVKDSHWKFCDQWFNFFLFKQDTNDYKSYEYEVSLIDIHIIYICILISFKLNYIVHKIYKYVNFKKIQYIFIEILIF